MLSRELRQDRRTDRRTPEAARTPTAPQLDPAAPVIDIRGVSHWFATPEKPYLALKEVDLAIPQGQFVCLVGPSGCGKTTLLNVIAQQIRPERGSVEVRLGDGVRSDRSSRQAMGYMFARDSLIPWRDIRDNVAFGLEVQGVGRSERRRRAEATLDLVGLGGKGRLFPRQLSHGMRQRANLARTLAIEPEVLLVDEPFGALDAQTKARLQVEFMNIWDRTRKTVVFVTHDLSEACLLADRIIVMRSGAIEADIPIEFERPRDLDALRFEQPFQDLVKSLWDMIAEDVR